jgi:orotate phosphoribosyltransferase
MHPMRVPTNKLSARARAFELIKQRSFARGRFVLVSGKESNYYLDMKPTMFHSEGSALLSELVLEKIKDLNVDYVGGIEMGAVPLVASVTTMSHRAARPVTGFFVRKDVKDHGTKKRVEALSGSLQGKNVVILEDVTTTGESAMKAVAAARDAGANVVLVLTVVDREEGAGEFYAKAGIPFDWLFRASEFLAS